MPLRLPWLTLTLLLGCSTESIRPSIASDASPVGTVEPHHCEGPGYFGASPEVNVVHISATVVDENGIPVPNMLAQACGVNVCVNGTTDGSGLVVIDTNSQQKKPAFKYGDGRTHAKFALLLDGGSPVDVDLGQQRTVAFDPPESGAELSPGKTASSRGVDLRLASDSNPVKPDPFDFDTPDLRKFRAAEVSAQNAPAAVDASLGFGIVYALTPLGTELCPPAELTIPNSANYPAGSAVEVYLHGIDVGETWAPYGGWAKVSSGTVSADGKTISTAEEGGLPALSAIGVRLAP
jgi:hypothetical protein